MERRDELTIAVLIDALGWDVVRETGFLSGLRGHASSLETVMGYSSAAIPSILTGQLPQVHGRWSYLFYSPPTSPFRWTRPLSVLGPLGDIPRVKAKVAFRTARMNGFDGYFPVYDFPMRHLHQVDHCSKRWDFYPGAFDCESIVDICARRDIPARFLTYPLRDAEVVRKCREALDRAEHDLYFLYLTELDATCHGHGVRSERSRGLISWYESAIRELLDAARRTGRRTRMMVFSDHGMVDVAETCPLKSVVEKLPLTMGRDYFGIYDSTMARFWYFEPHARDLIRVEAATRRTRLLSLQEKESFGICFPDDRYGQDIFLVNPGTVLHPSHMGRHVLKAMHGYDPLELSSCGFFWTTEDLDCPPSITGVIGAILGRDIRVSTDLGRTEGSASDAG